MKTHDNIKVLDYINLNRTCKLVTSLSSKNETMSRKFSYSCTLVDYIWTNHKIVIALRDSSRTIFFYSIHFPFRIFRGVNLNVNCIQVFLFVRNDFFPDLNDNWVAEMR